MRFEEFARKAGKAAAEVGRRAERLPIARVVESHRRRKAGWSVAAAAVVIVLGLVLLWPGSDAEAPLAAEGSTTTRASTPTSISEPTTTTLDDGMTSGVVEGGREACPVTAPGDRPFTPASETPEGPPPVYEAVWYGTPDLWTMVHHQGEVWADLPVAADGSLTQKTFWWSNDYVLPEELQPDISVTAEHLNGSAPTVTAGSPGTNGSHPDLGDFMIVGLEIPEEGCWRLTAEYRDTTLSYVAWVGDDTTT